MLDYENQILLDIFQEDGLVILARGLGIDRILANFIRVFLDPGGLVLILNTSQQEEEYLIQEIEKSGEPHLPRVINNEVGTNERKNTYMEGGVMFISSRILVVDLLTDRVPAHLISGIVVNKAHKIIDSCQEAFILRLFRQKNKKGFIKAFSDSPQSFSAGFCQLERVMKNLFVRKLFLWPRFHAEVSAVMDKNKPDVVELQLTMTAAMQGIQLAILDIINACIKEIKRNNPMLDTEELTVENAIGKKSLDQVIRRQLDPVWHQLNSSTRQLVGDLKLLRMLLYYLTQYDCVSFYNFLRTLRGSKKAVMNNSGWLFLDSADSMFVHAKERIYGPDKKNKKQKTDSTEASSENKKPDEKELVLEESPKWKMLAEILEEIKQENKEADESRRVLICASDDRTCAQLKEFLCDGSYALLKRLYDKTIGSRDVKSTAETEQGPSSKGKKTAGYKAKTKGTGQKQDLENMDTLTQMARRLEKNDNSDDDESKTTKKEKSKKQVAEDLEAMLDLTSPDVYFGIESNPVVVIHPLHGCKDPFSLVRTLNEVQPVYVILYDAEIQFVRQLELFRCTNPEKPLRVYFLMYTGSTEEQRYLTTLRQEKEAFEHLIKEKATLVVPEEIEGKTEIAPQLDRNPASAGSQAASTRKGGGQVQQSSEQQKIIVDMREFRSELPSLIHKRGIDIEPVTIEVGDYILTPDICVERKSVSDLIGSLNSGRLFNQVTAMTRFYKRPVLLIEFDPNKSFSLQPRSSLSSDISYQHVSSKLVLLTIHFPKLRILWCPSPHVTAELFEELKINRGQPSSETAASITADEDAITSSPTSRSHYNHGPYDMLLKLPGINTKNCWRILRSVNNIAELSTLPEDELTKLLDNAVNAKLLWDFFHKEQAPVTNPAAKTTFGLGKGTRRLGKR